MARDCGTCKRIEKCDGKPDGDPCEDYLDELMLHSLNYSDGKIDMSLSGEPAKLFMVTLIEFFQQNGGKNFLTMTINDRENNHLAVTIQNCNGNDTPAEKLERLSYELSEANNRIKYLEEQIARYEQGWDGKDI